MNDSFCEEDVTITAMIILTLASIFAPALLFTQTAVASTELQGNTTSTTTTSATLTAPNNTTQRVAVGGGNLTISINQFSPQNVTIKPGDSATFYAPSGSTEVHNVIFDLSNGTIISDIGVPFTLPSDVLGGEVPTVASQELTPAPPYNLGEPIIQNVTDDGTQAIIGFNKIAFYPAIVDQDDSVLYLEEEEINSQMLQMKQALEQEGIMPSGISANYTMDGTERVVSSGIVLDVNGFAVLEELFPEEERGSATPPEQLTEDNEGLMTNSTTSTSVTTTSSPLSSNQQTITQQEEFGTEEEQLLRSGESEEFPSPQFPFLDSFTVTFNEPGTYDYFCAFHPGMFGQVVVGSSGEGQTGQG